MLVSGVQHSSSVIHTHGSNLEPSAECLSLSVLICKQATKSHWALRMGGQGMERAPEGAAVTSATVQDHLVNCCIFKGVELVAWTACLRTTARGRPHHHLALLRSCHGHRTSGPAAQSGPEQGCLWVPRNQFPYTQPSPACFHTVSTQRWAEIWTPLPDQGRGGY